MNSTHPSLPDVPRLGAASRGHRRARRQASGSVSRRSHVEGAGFADLSEEPWYSPLRLFPCVAIRGRIGDRVYKTYGTKIITTRVPCFDGYVPTAAQRDRRDKMRAATKYAKAVYADPTAKAVYVAAARALARQPFQLAISDFLHGRMRVTPLAPAHCESARCPDVSTGFAKPHVPRAAPLRACVRTRTLPPDGARCHRATPRVEAPFAHRRSPPDRTSLLIRARSRVVTGHKSHSPPCAKPATGISPTRLIPHQTPRRFSRVRD